MGLIGIRPGQTDVTLMEYAEEALRVNGHRGPVALIKDLPGRDSNVQGDYVMVLKRMTVLVLLLLLQLSGYGKEMEVNAGAFAYFGVSLPTEMVAGKSYSATLNAYDSYGNLTDYFGEGEATFELHTSGGLRVLPERLTGAMFKGGKVTISISDRIAEEVTFDITAQGRPLLVKNERNDQYVTFFDLGVVTAPLANFALKVPKEPLAGEEFTMTITARDAQNNTIADYGNVGRGVAVSVEGKSAKRNYMVPAHAFSGGRATVALRYDIPETVHITARDLGNASAEGSVAALAMQPQQLERIDVKTPKSIRAGERFRVELRAYNQFGRLMQNYAAVGSDVTLSADGSGRLIPDRVLASAFFDGVAQFETRYTKSEAIAIQARPVGGIPEQQETRQSPAKAEYAEAPKHAEETPKGDAAPEAGEFPLTLRFSSGLGAIEKVVVGRTAEQERETSVVVFFANKGQVRQVQSFEKQIEANGRTIGTLSADGYVDVEGRLMLRIVKEEPFKVRADADGSTLSLRFVIEG